MSFSLFVEMIPISFMFAAPIVIAALGGLFSERSGVVNIALEGIMMVGAFAAAALTVTLETATPLAPWLGLLMGILAGIAFSSLHALASVNLRADQTISGTALNILAGGLTVYLAQVFFGQQRTRAFARGIRRITVPLLSDIPIVGDMIFSRVYPTFFITLVLVVLTWFIIYKTPLGLRLRSCGEHPQAAASMGINVFAMRYIGVLTSGGLAGLAGGTMVLTQDIQYTIGSVHGVGFIALASLIFGKWNPWGVLGAGLFFGFSQTLSLYANDIPFLAVLPQEFFFMLPYVLTIAALVVFAGKAVAPKAVGEIYDAGKR
ncbi:MAG TPA: ABC transporter permease [Magnetospirillaceae bacterium]|nr:ABC transporter permease [Magnetospirillaceae bacterium]